MRKTLYLLLQVRSRDGLSPQGREWTKSVLDGMAREFPLWHPPEAEEFTADDLRNACADAMYEFHWRVRDCAKQHRVPPNVLWDTVIHWVVADQMGWERPAPTYLLGGDDETDLS